MCVFIFRIKLKGLFSPCSFLFTEQINLVLQIHFLHLQNIYGIYKICTMLSTPHCNLAYSKFLCTDFSYSFLNMLMLQKDKSLVCSQRFFTPGRLSFFLLANVFDVRAGKTQPFDSGIRRPLCSNRRIYVVFGITEIGPK